VRLAEKRKPRDMREGNSNHKRSRILIGGKKKNRGRGSVEKSSPSSPGEVKRKKLSD